jgi:hypothetical protein
MISDVGCLILLEAGKRSFEQEMSKDGHEKKATVLLLKMRGEVPGR